MAQNNRINFQLDFKKGDTSAIDGLKNDIREIQRLAGDFNFTSDLGQKDLQGMINAAKTLETALDQAFDVDLNTTNIQKFNQILKQSGYNVETLKADLMNAGAVGHQAFLKATGQLMQFNTAAKQTNKFLDDIATSFFNTVKWGVMSSIINNISGTIQKSYYYVKDLDTALNDIRIVTGKGADEMSRFAEQANNAAKSLAVTTEDYAQGSLIYYQQGLDDDTVKTLADITAKTSNVTGQSMETVSEQLTAVWNGYKVANQAAEEGMQVYQEYVDKMAAVGATTASDLEELSTAMSKVASAASSMGVGFDDLNAQIATIVSVTRQAPESVGTALKTIYARLGDLKVDGVDEFGTKLGEVTTQLQTMGINILDQQGNMREMSDVIAEVAEKWDTWTSAQRQAAAVAMAGKRQYNNLIALFDNWDMYGEALETSLEAAGTLEKQQETAMDSLANKMDVLKATAEDLYDSLFSTETIGTFLEKGTKLLQFFADLTDSLGGLNNILPMLGSIGLQVFSEQIARGLASVVINARNVVDQSRLMKENFEQIKAAFADSSVFSYKENDAAMTKIVAQETEKIYNYYKEMYPYQQYMTKEEKEQYNYILQQKVALASQKVDLQAAVNNWRAIGEHFNLIDKNLLNSLGNVKLLASEMTKVNELTGELESLLKWVGKDIEAQDIEKRISELGLQKGTIQYLVGTWKEYYKSTENAAIATEKLIEDLNKIGVSTSNLTKLNANIESTKNNIQALEESFSTNLNITATIRSLTGFAGSLGQAVTTVAMFKNTLEQIGEEEDPMSLENIGRLLTSTGFMMTSVLTLAPQLATGLTKLKDIVGALANYQDLLNQKTALGEALGRLKIAQTDREIAMQALKSKGDKEEVANIMSMISFEEVESMELNENTKKQIENILARHGYVEVSGEVLTAVTANVVAENAETVAIGLNTKSKIANFVATHAWAIAIVAVTAAIAATTLAILKLKAAEEERAIAAMKQREEEQKAFQEAHDARRKEIEDTQDLIQSYIDLYSKYKNGTAEKDAMVEKTNELIDILGEERVAVANLTGDYESLNEEMREHQRNQIQEKINQNKEEATELKKQISTDTINLDSNQGALGAAYAKMNSDNPGAYASLEGILNQVTRTFEDGIEYRYELDFSKVSEQYLADNAGAILSALSKSGIDTTDIKRQLASITTLLSENKTLEVEKVAAGRNLDSVENYSQYNDILQDTIAELKNTQQYSKTSMHDVTEAALDILSGLSGNNKEYEQRARGTNYLVGKYGENYGKIGNVSNFANNLTDDELSLVLQGKIAIDKNTTVEEIHNQLDIIQKETAKEDLSIAVSLRAKLTSDKKLTKKEMEEFAQEQGILLQDYENELYDFENQSNLNQVRNLNAIVDEKIAANRRYLQDVEEDAQKEVDLYKKNLQEFEKLNNESKVRVLDKDERERYNELKGILESTVDTYEHYQELLNKDNGLLLEEFDSTIFDNLVSGLEGVVSEAEILRDIAEDVGENWIIAADDIEHFGKNFPEVLAAQENYNFLQDGSIQLTKEGQQILQDTVGAYKEELIAKNESYQLELQKQADIQKAQADYYKSMADNLRSYLNGEKTAGEVEASMAQDLSDFKAALVEAEAGDSEELAREMQSDLDDVTTNAKNNTSNIYEYWASVGTVAALAGKAYDEDFTDPGLNPSGKAGPSGVVSSSTYSSKRRNEGSDPLEGLWKMSDEQIQSLIDEYDKKYTAAYNRYSSYISEKNNLGASVNSAVYAMDNAASGKGGKGSKSSSKDKKDKENKLLEDEFDRYFDIKKAIEEVDHAVSILEKDQKNLHGKELIDSLKKENELIEKQTENYQKLYKAQQEEAKEVGALLKGKGVEFDKSGAISNYAEATAAALAEYNAAVGAYNAGMLDDAGFEIAEKSYEKFKKQLERYEELYYKELQDTFDKIDDNNRKVLENNLKSWETEIQVQLDLNEAERNWNKFFKEINTDFKKVFKDLEAEMSTIVKEASTYKSDIAVDMKAINDTTEEIDKLNADQGTDHTQSISQAQEKLKELNDQLMDHAKSLRGAYEDAWDAYLEGIDQAAEKFDKLNDQFDMVKDNIEYQGELIELIYGSKAYDLMHQYYDSQLGASANQIQSVKDQLAFWQKLYDETSEGDKDHEKALEKIKDLTQDLHSLTLEYLKTLKDQYKNDTDEIIENLQKQIFNGNTLEEFKEQWEDTKKFSEYYVDDLEKAAKIQAYSNKIQKEINKTNDIQLQQKLNKFRDLELKKLREKDHLTQADFDRAEKSLDVLKAEIALRDSQNNKTSMKMVRNEQGNWSYQYVADEEDVEDKRQDLSDAKLSLYEFDQDQMNNNVDRALEIWSTYFSRLTDLRNKYISGEIDSDTLKQEYAKLEENRSLQMGALDEDAAKNQQELIESTGVLAADVYAQQGDAFSFLMDENKAKLEAFKNFSDYDYLAMTDAIKTDFQNIGTSSNDLMNAMNTRWGEVANNLELLWDGDEESVRASVEDAYSKIILKNEEYEGKITELEALVDKKFHGEEGKTSIIQSLKDAESETVTLKDKTKELVNESTKKLGELRSSLEETARSWKSVGDQIQTCINKLATYLAMQGKEYTGGARSVEVPDAKSDEITSSTSGSKTKDPLIDPGNGDGDPSIDETSKIYVTYREGYGTIRGETYTEFLPVKRENMVENLVEEKAHGYYYDKDKKLVEFASGGYTGSWNGDNGKLAVLHKKELILNADDTERMLKMAELSYEIMKSTLNAKQLMLDSLAVQRFNYSAGASSESTNTGTTFYIDRLEFPNANSVNEIKMAIMSLPNVASQYVNRNVK